MKKIYFAPKMEVVEIKTTCMLAASLPLDGSTEISNSGDILAPEDDDFEFDF